MTAWYLGIPVIRSVQQYGMQRVGPWVSCAKLGVPGNSFPADSELA